MIWKAMEITCFKSLTKMQGFTVLDYQTVCPVHLYKLLVPLERKKTLVSLSFSITSCTDGFHGNHYKQDIVHLCQRLLNKYCTTSCVAEECGGGNIDRCEKGEVLNNEV